MVGTMRRRRAVQQGSEGALVRSAVAGGREARATVAPRVEAVPRRATVVLRRATLVARRAAVLRRAAAMTRRVLQGARRESEPELGLAAVRRRVL